MVTDLTKFENYDNRRLSRCRFIFVLFFCIRGIASARPQAYPRSNGSSVNWAGPNPNRGRSSSSETQLTVEELWEADLTYIHCGADGWAYLFNVVDVFSREWVSYVFDHYAVKENAILSVEKALIKHPKAVGVRLRTNHGSQYGSTLCAATDFYARLG